MDRGRPRPHATETAALQLPSGGVALHAAWIGPGLENAAFRGFLARAGGKPSTRPGLADLHAVAAAREFLPGRLREASFEPEMAEVRAARIERARRVLGVEFGAVDRLLQIHFVMDVVQKQLQRPLVLAIAARRAERHVGRAVLERQARRQGAARAFPRLEARGRAFLEPGDLQPRAAAEAQFRGDP